MATDSNSIVQSLWIGGQLSKVEQLCIQSFLDHGHEFHLYAYEDIKNAPARTQVIDASNIMPASSIFRYKAGWAKGSVSGFADVFRVMMVLKNGGWWVDMDMICLKKLDFKNDFVICSSYEGEYDQLVNNCIFKCPQQHPFLQYCLDEIKKIDLENMDFGLAGPFLFQRAIKNLGLEEQVSPYQIFNPIAWKNVSELVLGQLSPANKIKEQLRPIFKPATMPGRKISDSSYTVHFWNEVWKNCNLDKNGTYGSSSLFEKLKRKHGIS
ncbi:capsular polysaccharide synthesis protein [Mucilaginibacter yixingensis]|uniref:Capsular polysaccharide synthesis protein n=1 Tax=Mucilaginibacter yixingensis TaxID=1295612 RepID=A0A2T5JFS0_9SPHI|nr:glycosyltransferase [Mucilaginibacter yixingensis]PTR01273.1 capsular polysaccharide synthesis protein [Mucilaginibacter yixingensis]